MNMPVRSQYRLGLAVHAALVPLFDSGMGVDRLQFLAKPLEIQRCIEACAVRLLDANPEVKSEAKTYFFKIMLNIKSLLCISSSKMYIQLRLAQCIFPGIRGQATIAPSMQIFFACEVIAARTNACIVHRKRSLHVNSNSFNTFLLWTIRSKQ